MSTPVRRAIYGRLKSDTSLNAALGGTAAGYMRNIYHDPPPQDAGYPFVVISKSSGIPTASFIGQGKDIYQTDVWLVKGVDHNTTADKVEFIQSRIAQLLGGTATNGTTSLEFAGSATQLYLHRQSDIEYSEVIDGEVYRHAGSLFRLIYVP